MSRVTVGIESEIIDSSVVLDTAFVRSGSGIAIFAFTNTGSPFESEVRSDAMVAVVRRLRDGLDRLER